MDYYAVLGVPANAGADAIRRAYRKLVRRYHPDAGAGSSQEKFRQIVEAYATLNNPARRRTYDRSRTVPRAERTEAQRENAEWLAEMRRWLDTAPFTGGRSRW